MRDTVDDACRGVHLRARRRSRSRPCGVTREAHFALHYGDEYREEGRPEERVHEEDQSGLASRGMSRLALLHARHFAFAPLFVNRVMELSGRSCGHLF